MIIQSTVLGNSKNKIILQSNNLYLTAQYNTYAGYESGNTHQHLEDRGITSLVSAYICSEANNIAEFTPTVHTHYVIASTTLLQVGHLIGRDSNDSLLGISFGKTTLAPIFKLGTPIPSTVNTSVMIANEILNSRVLILGHKTALENTTQNIDYTDSETGYHVVGFITIGTYTNQRSRIEGLGADIHVYGPDYIGG